MRPTVEDTVDQRTMSKEKNWLMTVRIDAVDLREDR